MTSIAAALLLAHTAAAFRLPDDERPPCVVELAGLAGFVSTQVDVTSPAHNSKHEAAPAAK